MSSDIYKNMINHVVPSDSLMQEVRDKMVTIAETRVHTPGTAHRKLMLCILLVLATAAFVFVFTVFESNDSQAHNSFSIRIHTLEQQRNGSVTLQEGTIAELSVTMTGDFIDSEGSLVTSYSNLYQSINFHIEGENIKQVEFFIDNGGAFKKVQYLTENGEFVDSISGLTIISETYLGNSFTLDDLGSLEDGYVILAGKPGIVTKSSSLEIQVIATFNDNTTQEEYLNIYLPLP